MAQLVEIDSRRRISLGQLARHDRYLVEVQPDGTLILTPAVVMTDLEARFLRNTDLLGRIAAVEADPSQLVQRPVRRRPKTTPTQADQATG